MAALPLTLESPVLTEINARGVVAGEQRRALARDLYREHWKTPVKSLGWIAGSLIMLRILFPVFGRLVETLFTEDDVGLVPLRFPAFTVSLPLWTMLKVFLVLLTLAYVAVIAVQVKHLVGFLRLRHAILYGRVVTAVGDVHHRGGVTSAIFAGRLLRPWDARVMAGVEPGRYRFFLLPSFDWLLSAQRLRDWERPTADEEALAARYSLGGVSGFAPAALADNDAGRLTPEQARRLRDTAPDIGWRIFVLFGFAIAIGVVGAGVYAREAMRDGFTTARLEGIGAGLAWAAIWVAILVLQFRAHARQRRDADAGRVAMYEGVVTKWEGWKHGGADDSPNIWIYRYECDAGKFEVSQAAYRALADGLVHRVYYTPESKQLINIELIEAGANKTVK